MQPARMNYLGRKPGPNTGPRQTKGKTNESAPKGFGSESASRGKIARGQSSLAKKCEMGIKGQTKMNKFGCR